MLRTLKWVMIGVLLFVAMVLVFVDLGGGKKTSDEIPSDDKKKSPDTKTKNVAADDAHVVEETSTE